MSKYIDHLTNDEIGLVVRATLNEENVQSIMELLGDPIDGRPVGFSDRFDIQVRALNLDQEVAKRLAEQEQERRRVRIIESDIHFATRKARELVTRMLDALDSDIPQWVMEFSLENAGYAIEEFRAGGVVPDLIDDESLHLQDDWESALRAVLTAVHSTATDENAQYNEEAVRIA